MMIARKIFLAVLLIVLFTGAASAQTYLGIKIGTMNPKDTKAGFLIGLATGRQVDERVDFGLAADLFIRKFTQESDVGEVESGEITGDIVRREIEFSMYALPIMAQLTINVMPNAVVEPYASISAGYEMVLSSEANYITDDKDSRFYGGFGWQLAAGAKYPLGFSSSILGEIFYNGATVKRSKGEDAAGFPIHEELSFSGLGFRVGVWLSGF
jgi:hypothetical protein